MGLIASILNPHTSAEVAQEEAPKNDDGLLHCGGKVRCWGKKRKVILRWVGVFFVVVVLALLPVCIWVLRESLDQDLHIIAWFVAGIFALLTLPISAFGIILHLNHYNKPIIQRYILRIMWMPPIYGLACWFSLLFRHYSVYWTLLREFYEAYCIYCFLFFLMALLDDNAKTLAAEKEDRENRRAAGEIVEEPVEAVEPPKYGRKWLFCGEKVLKPQTWVWMGSHEETEPVDPEHPHMHHLFPCCWLPEWSMEPIESNMTNDSNFAANCRYGVLLYVVLKVLTSIATFILVLCDAYGEGEFRVDVGYPYCALVYNVAQLWAMYCLVCFYHTFGKELAPYRPFPKFCAIKAVVFFAFWQSVIIAGAVSNGYIAKPAETLYSPHEISAGLQDLIIAIEMFIAAWFHLYAFSHQDYKKDGAEKLSVFQMIHTIFDVKDVAVDLKIHAKVHANVIKKIKKDNLNSKSDRQGDSDVENSVSLMPTKTVTIVATTTPAPNDSDETSANLVSPSCNASSATSSSSPTNDMPAILVNLQEDSEVTNSPKTTVKTMKEDATVVPVTVTTSGPVASVTVEVEKC